MSAKYDILIEQGASKIIPITISGAFSDLTEYTAKSQIRRTHKSDTIVAEFTCTIGDPPTAGILELSLTPEQTSLISAGESLDDSNSRYVWDLTLANIVTGIVTRLLDGNVFVSPGVTR